MPFPSFYRSGPAAGTQDEQQRLLRQEHDEFAGYTVTVGDRGASSERGYASGTCRSPRRGGSTPSGNNAASSQDVRYDTLPPQYTSTPMGGYGASPSFDAAITHPKFGIGPKGWYFVAFGFILGGLIAWVVQDMWALSVLSPGAIEKRRLAWDRDYTKHLAQVSAMQDITAKWAQEIEQHASAREGMRKERAEWDKERAQWQAERRERVELELEQKRRELEKEKEEEERKKAGLTWQDPQPDEHCLRFGTRRYTAKLENVSTGYNRMKACQETQAWVNGRWVTPTQCNDGGLWGGVHGTWIVDWDEGGCHSYFETFNDKGCTTEGSGKRRIESKLQNIRSGDDGLKMCASTPADFHGLHFDAPHSCASWLRGLYGPWGLWFIEDGSCA